MNDDDRQTTQIRSQPWARRTIPLLYPARQTAGGGGEEEGGGEQRGSEEETRGEKRGLRGDIFSAIFFTT